MMMTCGRDSRSVREPLPHRVRQFHFPDGTTTRDVRDTVGWLQYKLGNYPQAVALLQDAVRKGGTAPVYRYHLGMAYFKSDMKPQAREELELALTTDREFAGRDEAEQALQQL